MGTSGTDLLTRMAAGDREAFAVFYDRYAPVVFLLILRIVRERADASDVLRDVFREAWQTAVRYDPARDAAEAAEDRGTIRNALERLPGAQREVIELAYVRS
jgi:RNA polymerase sigma-70 factor (ECF subfamily)